MNPLLIFCFICCLFNTPIILKAAAPEWMINQITKDLSFFQNGIDEIFLSQIMEDYSSSDSLFRFKIINGDISIETKYSDCIGVEIRRDLIQKALLKIISQKTLPDLDFIICMDDASTLQKSPVFVFAKNQHNTTQILMPDHEALDNGYEPFRNGINEASKLWPWKNKQEIAFWRGSTTGGIFDLTHWQDMPRSLLVILSHQYPSLVDAKFTQFTQGAESNSQMQSLPWLFGNGVSRPDSLQYKYLVTSMEIPVHFLDFFGSYFQIL